MSVNNSENGHQRDSLEKRINQVLALMWVIVGVVVFIQSRNLRYMAQYGPGPGFLPLWLGVAFILLGLALLFQVTFSRKESEVLSLPNKRAARQMFLIMFGFFGLVFLAEKVGFLLCLGLLFLFLLIVVERKGWKLSLAISIIASLIFWVVFELGLKLRLPAGLLD